MYNPFIETDGEPYITGYYGPNNEDLDESKLTEVFVTVYTIKRKGEPQPEEVYAFTTDFEQAFKRFKLLPHNKCFLKRFFTDNAELIRLAVEGTKPKIDTTNLDYSGSEYEGIELRELLDRFRDEDEEGKPIYDTGCTESLSDTLPDLSNLSLDSAADSSVILGAPCEESK